ncbi:hypothetical protein ACH61_01028 [Rathayibacter tanaceti]|uniref:Uncharacterized protein n=1 Tax=Rathayibacter tanaceti TaxID=1671680 RepID=A0A168G6Q1_9MICO|nr:hypothetical protein ACH61_01028 [Rathayibacter tanaceti]
MGAEPGQRVRDALGQPLGAQHAEDPRRRYLREEALEVERHDHRGTGVHRGTADRAAAGHEAVHGGMHGGESDQLVEDAPLDRAQPWPRHLEQPRGTAGPLAPDVVVVLHRTLGGAAVPVLHVGEGLQLAGCQGEQPREVAPAVDPRHGGGGGARPGGDRSEVRDSGLGAVGEQSVEAACEFTGGVEGRMRERDEHPGDHPGAPAPPGAERVDRGRRERIGGPLRAEEGVHERLDQHLASLHRAPSALRPA